MVIKQTHKSRISLPICNSGTGCFGRKHTRCRRTTRKSTEKHGSVYRLSYFNTLIAPASKRRNAIRYKNRPVPFRFCFRWDWYSLMWSFFVFYFILGVLIFFKTNINFFCNFFCFDLIGKQVMVHDKYVVHRIGVKMLSLVIIFGFLRRFPVRRVTWAKVIVR